jgi:YfiH family protein
MDHGDYLVSTLLAAEGFVHAFFTRRGGVSEGPFSSLNLSRDVGDRVEHVEENLRQAARVLLVDPGLVCAPRQVHGDGVLVIEDPGSAAAVGTASADATLSGHPGLACGVRSADCVPILLADREAGRVAAVHAGWRGVTGKVLAAAVARLRSLGSRPGALVAAIGPHISVAAFEVGEDVALALARASSAEHPVKREPGQKPRVDLSAIVRAQLLDLGITNDAVEDIGGCTYSDPAKFFSFRRDGRESGRMLSAIVASPRGARVS